MQLNRNALLPSKMDISDYAILKIVFVIVVEEPGFKNVKNKHLGMPPF